MAETDGDWTDRIRTIAESLLTLEVNTIEKPNMSAAKMPDMPLALHQIVRLYADELAGQKCFVTDELLGLAQARIDDGENVAHLNALKAWRHMPGDKESDQITNGPKTFEALQWVALAARDELDTAPQPDASIAVYRAVLSRIIINARQLRQMTLMMLQRHSDVGGATQLFDGTIEATTGILFKHPRPKLQIDTDILLFVRKVWDIGLERVTFQTAMQVDGDMLVRVAPHMEPAKQAFFADLHRSTVEVAIRQWRGLFDLVGTLMSSVGRALFGPRV